MTGRLTGVVEGAVSCVSLCMLFGYGLAESLRLLLRECCGQSGLL